MIHNLIRAAHELIFNRKISNMNSNTVQGAIDELKGTLGYTKKNHFKYITDGFEYNGIVAQKNSDGSMTVSGTATDNVDYQIGVDIYPENEQYILSGYTEGADADCNIYAAYWEDASTWKSAEAVLDDKGVLITKAKGNLCKVCLYVAKGKTVNLTFYPMVRYASIQDDTFESYVPSLNEYLDIMDKLEIVSTNCNITRAFVKNGDVHIIGNAKKQTASGIYDLFTIKDAKYKSCYTVVGSHASFNNSTDNSKVAYIRVSSEKGTMWLNNSISTDIYFNFKYPLI